MLAFTFPGQGSQRPGMGRPWADHESWELVEEASTYAERDVAQLLLDADAEELKDTRNAQLCTFVTSLMVLDAVERLGIEPSYCAGHSLGEYTALTASGALSFDDGVRLVCERAEAMHEAGIDNPGTMAAVLGLDDEDVEIACRRADSDVWVANFNAPGQVVIAGSAEGVTAAGAVAKELGAKRVMPLPVSGAFHTPYMASARDGLAATASGVPRVDPRVTLLGNGDGAVVSNGDDVVNRLVQQVANPVRWDLCMQTMRDIGITALIELPPAGTLVGLAKRAMPGVETLAVKSPDDLDAARALLQRHNHVHSEPAPSWRIAVAPISGTFRPREVTPGTEVAPGDLVGTVVSNRDEAPVAAAHGGVLVEWLAHDGDPVSPGQPLARLHPVAEMVGA